MIHELLRTKSKREFDQLYSTLQKYLEKYDFEFKNTIRIIKYNKESIIENIKDNIENSDLEITETNMIEIYYQQIIKQIELNKSESDVSHYITHDDGRRTSSPTSSKHDGTIEYVNEHKSNNDDKIDSDSRDELVTLFNYFEWMTMPDQVKYTNDIISKYDVDLLLNLTQNSWMVSIEFINYVLSIVSSEQFKRYMRNNILDKMTFRSNVHFVNCVVNRFPDIRDRLFMIIMTLNSFDVFKYFSDTNVNEIIKIIKIYKTFE